MVDLHSTPTGFSVPRISRAPFRDVIDRTHIVQHRHSSASRIFGRTRCPNSDAVNSSRSCYPSGNSCHGSTWASQQRARPGSDVERLARSAIAVGKRLRRSAAYSFSHGSSIERPAPTLCDLAGSLERGAQKRAAWCDVERGDKFSCAIVLLRRSKKIEQRVPMALESESVCVCVRTMRFKPRSLPSDTIPAVIPRA